MSNALKLAAAVGVLAAVGWVATGGPAPRPAPSVVGAPSPAPDPGLTVIPQPPTEFTGQITCDPPGPDRAGPYDVVREGTTRILEADFWQARGYAYEQDVIVSDPRLEGAHVVSVSRDEYHSADYLWPIMVASFTRRIENDEGAWQGSYTAVAFSDGTVAGSTAVLVGEGAYEGLTALWVEQLSQTSCSAEVRGVLFDGPVPPAPELYVGE
jgi:hypothetical protein